MKDITAIQNGKLGKGLKLLTDEVVGKESWVIDPHLGRSEIF